MQLTIDIPDELGERLGSERARLTEIIERGLTQVEHVNGMAGCALAEEVLEFLARGPQPSEIVAFSPSEKSIQRIRELLDKNGQGKLTRDEAQEMEHIGVVNNLFSLLKAYARQHMDS